MSRVPALDSVVTAKPSVSRISIQAEQQPQLGSFKTWIAGSAACAKERNGDAVNSAVAPIRTARRGRVFIVIRFSILFESLTVFDELHLANDHSHSSMRRKRSALVITDTDDRLIAAAAIIGESRRPVTGYSSPAAMGTPSAL